MDKLESEKKTKIPTYSKPSSKGIRLKHACHNDDCDSLETLKYGYEIGKPISCSEHKTDKMFNVYYKDYCKTCIQTKEFPPKRAKFGRTSKVPEFCSKHNTEKLPDVMSVKCETCVDNNLPDKERKSKTFGMPGKPAKWCKEHAPEGAEPKSGYYCECGKQASLGFPDEKPTHCSAHAEEGMIRLNKK